MTRGSYALVLLSLVGCTSIPAPIDASWMDVPVVPPDASGLDATSVDAGLDTLPDGGTATCSTATRVSSGRGAVVFSHPGPVSGRGVAWTFDLVELDGVTGLLEVLLVGDLDALEESRRPVALTGETSDLATCRHCVLFWPGCTSVPELCAGEPLVPIAGRAFVFHAPSGVAEDEFDVGLGGLVLAPARLDRATLETEVVGGACVSLPYVRLAGVVEESDCTFSQVACTLTARSDR